MGGGSSPTLMNSGVVSPHVDCVVVDKFATKQIKNI